MAFIEGLILNMIYLLFPFLLYLIYIAYKKNLNQQENKLFFYLSLFTSLYLIMRFGDKYAIILVNVPLLISYIKKDKVIPLVLSFIICYFYIEILQFNVYFILIEYMIYYLIFERTKVTRLTSAFLINTFVIIKSSVLSFEVFYFIKPDNPFFTTFFRVLSLMIVFYVVSFVILNLLEKGDEIVDLNNTLKELEKEKALRNSLFKITHEIKNPIAVCKGYLDMLDTNNKDKVNKYIPIIKQEISRTLTLMDDFLDYTKMKMNKEIIDIFMLLDDTCKSLVPLFKSNKVKTDFKDYDYELYLLGDYNRLKQVFVNVFKNAMEAKREDRELTISLRTKILQDKLIITIKDNGIGMDDETLAHVSEMFYTTKKKGSGLGTALSKEIIEKHDGLMEFDSKLGVGTKVIITLPITNDLLLESANI